MKRDAQHAALGWRAAKAVLATLVVGVTAGASGCLSRPIDPITPFTTVTETEVLPQTQVDKIDLLLMLDNSSSMLDKQTVLSKAVPDLVNGLLNPPCVDVATGMTVESNPASPLDMCPANQKREFTVVKDVHIGIVTSSLGGVGCVPAADNHDNDAGHLVARIGTMGTAPTYQNQGFLAWDASGTDTPPGVQNLATLGTTLTDMVAGVGQNGCGYEHTLEAWYRFLVDPAPYASVVKQGSSYVQMGTDNTVIQERADFMRPSSLLAIIMLSDENDCSVKDYDFYPTVMVQTTGLIPRGTTICETDPLNKCCYNCQLAPPDGCSPDPICMGGGSNAPLPPDGDSLNLRCWHNKQRYGIDFLYPTQRYVLALTQAEIPDPHAGGGADGTNTEGPMVPNPIFSNLNPNGPDHTIRNPGLVFIAGIHGVPWQDIAEDFKYTNNNLVYKTPDEMNAQSVNYNGKMVSTWDVILGDPDNYVDPLDPHMIESITPRSGTDPITMTALAPPNSAADADPINGHEWNIPLKDDLQYACAFVLATPCTSNCGDCPSGEGANADNPLCSTTNPSEQYRAKGYPGIRELDVLKQMGGQGIVGSICPAQLTNESDSANDFGYRPAIQGIINRLKTAIGGQCLDTQLNVTAQGQVQCLIIEARVTDAGACDPTCKDHPARVAIPKDSQQYQAVLSIEQDPIAKAAGFNCFCGIEQLDEVVENGKVVDNDLDLCLETPGDDPLRPDGSPVSGWCYVDPNAHPPNVIPAKSLYQNCPSTEQRLVHFVGFGQPVADSTLYITCAGENN